MTTATEKDIRISAADLLQHFNADEPALILDARSPRAWDKATSKIQGAIRVCAEHFQPDSCWPRDRFTLAYCT
jgi:hypothetical protein